MSPITLITILFVTLFSVSCAKKKVIVEQLAKTSESWDKEKISYPKSKAQVSLYKITLPPRGSLPFHCHPVPSFAYVESGAVEVELRNGDKRLFEKGEVIAEVVSKWHRGRNPSSFGKTELIVFYAGSVFLENTIYFDATSEKKCQ